MKKKRIRANLADEEKQEKEIKKQKEHAEQLMAARDIECSEKQLELQSNPTNKQ